MVRSCGSCESSVWAPGGASPVCVRGGGAQPPPGLARCPFADGAWTTGPRAADTPRPWARSAASLPTSGSDFTCFQSTAKSLGVHVKCAFSVSLYRTHFLCCFVRGSYCLRGATVKAELWKVFPRNLSPSSVSSPERWGGQQSPAQRVWVSRT